MHCLIVGGAGVLRPAALQLLRDGHALTVTARRQSSIAALGDAAASYPGSVHGIAGDYERPGALERALAAGLHARGRFSLALVYTAGEAPVARAALAAHPPDLMVHVLTSTHAAPGRSDARRARDALRGRNRSVRLLLGWTRDGAGARWHTPAEISAAALEARAAEDGSERVLGVLRPWRERPVERAARESEEMARRGHPRQL